MLTLYILVSTPRGFTTLTTYGMRLYLPVASRNSVEGNLYALELEEQVNIANARGILSFCFVSQ